MKNFICFAVAFGMALWIGLCVGHSSVELLGLSQKESTAIIGADMWVPFIVTAYVIYGAIEDILHSLFD